MRERKRGSREGGGGREREREKETEREGKDIIDAMSERGE